MRDFDELYRSLARGRDRRLEPIISGWLVAPVWLPSHVILYCSSFLLDLAMSGSILSVLGKTVNAVLVVAYLVKTIIRNTAEAVRMQLFPNRMLNQWAFDN